MENHYKEVLRFQLMEIGKINTHVAALGKPKGTVERSLIALRKLLFVSQQLMDTLPKLQAISTDTDRLKRILMAIPPHYSEAHGDLSVGASVWPDSSVSSESFGCIKRHICVVRSALPGSSRSPLDSSLMPMEAVICEFIALIQVTGSSRYGRRIRSAILNASSESVCGNSAGANSSPPKRVATSDTRRQSQILVRSPEAQGHLRCGHGDH